MSITLSPAAPLSSPVKTALDVAREVTRKAPESLSDSALTLYSTLVAAAVETARRREYSPNTTHVTFHCPLEQVARACGLSRQTAWRHLPHLKALGVIDFKSHKGSLFGETRNTGTLWQVRLNPIRGSRAKLTNDDLRHKWRDLEADYKRYRMSSLTLKKHPVTYTKDFPNIDLVLAWAAPLTPCRSQTPVKALSNRALEAVLDVIPAEKENRNRMVELAAQALAQALGDASSVSWHQKLLWQLLRRFDATGEDYSYSVYLAAQRAHTDSREGFARRAGALFHSRLKQADWFGEVMAAPPTRVGTAPIS